MKSSTVLAAAFPFFGRKKSRNGRRVRLRPSYCAGCRQLLPADGRERGQVKWYDPRKQYGFIVRTGQPDLYVHRSALRSGRTLRPDDLVEFGIEQTERGPAATTSRSSCIRRSPASPDHSRARHPVSPLSQHCNRSKTSYRSRCGHRTLPVRRQRCDTHFRDICFQSGRNR